MILEFLHSHDNTDRCKTHKRSSVSMFRESKATCSDEVIPTLTKFSLTTVTALTDNLKNGC